MCDTTKRIHAHELKTLISGTFLTAGDCNENEISSALTGDLLSWIMARGMSRCAWVTIQTHMNVVAVAALNDMALIILPEGVKMPDEEIKKAESESIAIMSSPLSAYEICGILYQNGILPTSDKKE